MSKVVKSKVELAKSGDFGCMFTLTLPSSIHLGRDCFSETSGEVDGNITAEVEMGLTVGNYNWPEWGVAVRHGNRTAEWLQKHPHSRTLEDKHPCHIAHAGMSSDGL
mgnify:CR=1 FL=1